MRLAWRHLLEHLPPLFVAAATVADIGARGSRPGNLGVEPAARAPGVRHGRRKGGTLGRGPPRT
jgi:hypothetical protein